MVSFMRKIFVLMTLGVVLVGCASKEAEKAPESPASDASESGVGVTSPAVGGASPVTNPESVQGAGGGGVGRAALDRARSVSGTASEKASETDSASDN